jgi:hypothetical protein
VLFWSWRDELDFVAVCTMTSDHRHQLSLGIGVAVDVPLSGLDRPVPG